MKRSTGLSDRLLREISGQGLFYAVIGVFLILATAFCFFVFSSANRANEQSVQSIEQQMLRILEEDGVSGLAAAFDRTRNIVLPGTDRVELVLWQVRGNRKRVLFETAPGAALAFQSGETHVDLENHSFDLRSVDVNRASRDWTLPMSDVALVFGVESPSAETHRAQTLTAVVIGLSVTVCALLVFLQITHWQRYRRSLNRVNELLERYSSGETGIRFEDESPAPELRELGRQLNETLPKIDGLFADLRALSAHLAHELRTPLQNIRSGVRKVVRAEDVAERRLHAQQIDAGIDAADARLQSVMQLFRLQADAEVTYEKDVALGDLFEDLVYDFEEALERQDRPLQMNIEKPVFIEGNSHLLELMIANLLSNASKYGAAKTPISASLKQNDGRFELIISNGGVLSETLKGNAFDRYAQGETHQSITGFGLGLSLVKAIAQKHRFSIELVEETGTDRVAARIIGDIQPENGES